MSRTASDENRTGTVSLAAGSGGVRPGAFSELLQEVRPEDQEETGWRLALSPGAVIGRFELRRQIGQGGFGVVYEARDRELGRLVAFKAVRAGPRQEVREERLFWEAETAARLSHPNIVTLFDVGRAAEGPYLVMELLRGRTLGGWPDHGPVPLREALRIAVEVGKGLAHAHAQGVIHRDLTPGNIFLCEDGQVKVLDLGLAHAFGHRKIDGGTPSYMAPEQRRGAPEDERTDVFAMGVILFEMLTGDVPFAADGGLPVPESATAPLLEVPEEPALGELIAQMLSADPVKRPRDAGEVLAALTVIQLELERLKPTDARPRPVLRGRPAQRSHEHSKPERNWVCSVLVVDIVRYSDQSVELQAEWKARFNGYLGRSIKDVLEADRVILDTGDGVAICFLGDPDAALSCAMGLLGTLVREENRQGSGMRVRAGMHLGAVKLVRDINGNLNALGDGLHVAQRVMGFAGENQILASRAFYEVASCLSELYRPLFAFDGIHRDEQMREHAVYEIHFQGAATGHDKAVPSSTLELSPSPAAPSLLDAGAGAAIESRAAGILGPIAHHLARTVGARVSTPRQLGEALAAFMPESRDREEFLRSCGARSPPTSAGTGGRTVSPASAFSAGVLERARRELAGYLGPVARILVDRTSAKAHSEEELYDLLSAEIRSAKDREAFLKKGPSARPR
jgi:serine/threonine protein kinase